MFMGVCLNYYIPSPLTYWFTHLNHQTLGLTTGVASTTTVTPTICWWFRMTPSQHEDSQTQP
jgi:hypothetical protein